MKLNLGCGIDYRRGWTNLDYDSKIKTDINFDINKLYQGSKLPFKDNYFDKVILYDVLEHFSDPLPILREVYRVCNIGGYIEIKVPEGDWTWDNLDHKRQFNYDSFNLVNFDYQHDHKKNIEVIQIKRYVLPSRFKLIRWILGKTNLHIIYRKMSSNVTNETNTRKSKGDNT